MKKRKCCNCKERYPVDEGMILPAGFFHSMNCVTEYSTNKVRKQRASELKRKAKVDKQKHSTLKKKVSLDNVRHQRKLTQQAFNKMRVLEELKWFKTGDLYPYCISCLQPLGGDQWCCGHFKTSGGNSRLTFDRKNTYLQHNRNCNMAKSGDIDGYKKGLAYRFGEQEAKEIISYCEQNTQAKKWTGEELSELRKGFNSEIRRLQREQDQC